MSETQRTTEESALDLREEINKYLRYWPWFVITVFIFTGCAMVFLRYATPIYSTTSTILIKDGGGGGSELATLEQLGVLNGSGRSSMVNELGLLKSRRIMTSVVKSLNLHISYFADGDLQNRELYTNTPVELRIIDLNLKQLNKLGLEARSFVINRDASGGIRLTNTLTQKVYTGQVENPMDIGFARVVVLDNPKVQKPQETQLRVVIDNPERIAVGLKGKLGLSLPEKGASLIEMSMQSNVPQKARDILDKLVEVYNADAISDNNEISKSTGKFIDWRLNILLGDLDTVESDIEEFKEERRLTDLNAEASQFMTSASVLESKRRELNMQQELVKLMAEYLEDNTQQDLLPANLGISAEGVNTSIQEYNTLVLERNALAQGATEKNPEVVSLNRQIAELRGNIVQSLNTVQRNLEATNRELAGQEAQIDQRILSVPSTERLYREIARQQEVKQSLYLFLLEKREENALKAAVNVPKAKVVDPAYGARVISPNSNSILLGAVMAGLLLPFGVIYGKRLLNNKIERREDVEKISKQIPIVGELPKMKKGESDLIEENDRSVLAESFRILTTNLQYLLVNASNDGKGYCIYTTSTVKGEGKTFTSINLAMTLANTGKKVVVIGADLRNPQLQRYDTESKSLLGVSDYLVNNDHKLETLVHDSKFHPNLKLFLSGSIPPNPSELLRQSKFGIMIQELRERYDYVIVDTAPAMLVADTFLISKYADLILYVTRAGYTEKKLLNFAVNAQNDGKLHDVSFVINDVKTANFGYGNKYGYAYGEDKPSLWERFKSSF